MSYNGSGTFLINSAGQPVVSGTVISSTAFNALTADLATGLSTAITKDGQTTPTANIPMGNNKITGLAVGTAATDAATLSQAQSTAAKLITASGADTVTGTLSPTLAAYATGQMFYWVAAGDNTGAVTLNIDSLGAKAVTRDGTTALSAGDIQSGEVCVVVYDGTRFQLINGASQSASITTENLTVNKATVLNESGGDNDTRIEGDTDANLFFVDASTDAVGIGTASPGSFGKLTTFSSGSPITAYHSVLSSVGIYNNPFESTVYLGLARTDVVNNNAIAGYRIKNYGANATGSYLAIEAASSAVGANAPPTTFTERLRLDSSGNLGLGVTPSAWSTSGVLQLPSGGNISASTGIGLNANAYFNSGWKYIASSNASQYVQSGGSHLWYNAPSGTAGNAITFTQAMTLDSSGNLGLGVTPNAWGSGQKAIQTPAGAIWNFNNANMTITQNAFSDGTEKYVNNGFASKYNQNSGQHIWSTAASGTAGNTITFTQAMTLDASGNLGVGTNLPACRLHVDGQEVRLNASSGAFYSLYTAGTRDFYAEASAGAVNLIGTTNKPMIFGTNNAERARITATGSVVAGGSVALATTATDGFLYVPTCAGTPTGTPTSITGMAPIVVNTTNNKLYFYSGGQWRDAGP